MTLLLDSVLGSSALVFRILWKPVILLFKGLNWLVATWCGIWMWEISKQITVLRMCVCMCVSMFVVICMCLCVRINMYVYVCGDLCGCIYVYTYVWISIFMYHVCMYVCMYVCICVYVYVVCVCVHVSIYLSIYLSS